MITNTNNFLNNETMESCKNNVSLVISKILRNHFSNDNSTVNQIDETIYKIDENQKNILIFIAKILSSLSITGIFFVIFIFTFCRSVRSFVLELAVWLCATHLIFDICLFFPNDEYKQNWCVFIGVMCTFSYFSTNVWTTLIGFFSYYSIIKSSFIDKNKKYLRLIFITIAYFIPGIFIMM
jgi:hypothetical protein